MQTIYRIARFGQQIRRRCFLLLAAGILFGNSACHIEDTREGAGTALDFSLKLVNGKVIDAAEFFGSVVLINFWDTRCGSCHAEQDDLNRLFAEHHNEGLVIIGIALAAHGLTDVLAYLTENHVEYISGVFGESVRGRLGQPSVIPRSVLVDRVGVLVNEWTGARAYDELLEQINPLLSE